MRMFNYDFLFNYSPFNEHFSFKILQIVFEGSLDGKIVLKIADDDCAKKNVPTLLPCKRYSRVNIFANISVDFVNLLAWLAYRMKKRAAKTRGKCMG